MRRTMPTFPSDLLLLPQTCFPSWQVIYPADIRVNLMPRASILCDDPMPVSLRHLCMTVAIATRCVVA